MTCSGMRAYGNGMRLASVRNQGAVLVARYRKTIADRPHPFPTAKVLQYHTQYILYSYCSTSMYIRINVGTSAYLYAMHTTITYRRHRQG